MGLPGSGKSFFAERLAALLHAAYASSDHIRKSMFPVRTYSSKEKEQVYDEMINRMRLAISEGKNIIMDGTFYLDNLRQKFIRNALPNCTIIFIEVVADEAIIRERLKMSRKDSEADFKVYQLLKTQWEPLKEAHLTLHSTDENIAEMLEIANQYIQSRNDKGTN